MAGGDDDAAEVVAAPAPPPAARSFEQLLAVLREQHELEVERALERAHFEKRQLYERLAASDEDRRRLRSKVTALEAATALGDAVIVSDVVGDAAPAGAPAAPAKTGWTSHPCFVDVETELPPPSPRGEALNGGECVDPVEKIEPEKPRSSPLAEDALAELSKLREAAGEDDEEQKRLAKRYEENQVGPHMRVSYMKLDRATLTTNWRKYAFKLVSSPFFDAAIGLVIVGNAITIGIETSAAVASRPTPLAVTVIESVFLVVYVLELALRFYAVGVLNALKAGWVKFDSFLVFCGLLDVVIRAVIGGQSLEALEKVMLVRMLRLARLARTVRLLVQFRTLWLLVEGLMHSLMTLLWTFLIIVALTYIFAIAGMELIREDATLSAEYNVAAKDNFTNLMDSMLTLFQFFTLDSVAAIYRPVIQAKPFLLVYFVGFILLVSISLMNLITAIMVESSMRQANDDIAAKKAWEAQKKKELMPHMMKMFKELDADGSGELELDEIQGAPEELKEQLLHVCNMDDLEELFNLLDYDGSGVVDTEEFIEGIMRTTSDKPPELLRLMKQCSVIMTRTQRIEKVLDGMTSGQLSSQRSREDVLVDTFV